MEEYAIIVPEDSVDEYFSPNLKEVLIKNNKGFKQPLEDVPIKDYLTLVGSLNPCKIPSRYM